MSIEPTTSSGPGRKRRRVGPRTFRGRLLAGALIIVPIGVTGWLLVLVFRAALWVGKPLVAWAMEGLRVIFRMDQPHDLGAAENVVAVLLTFAMLYTLGWLGSNVVGQRFISLAEALLGRIPFVDTIYTSTKRMIASMTQPAGGAGGQSVVLIDFPAAPLRTLGFMTNTITDAATGKKFATVYVPTTPNPTSGYMEFVPLEKVQVTNWTMQEALTTILSGGASAPASINLKPPV